MSLRTWMAEFYPVDATDAPRAEALQHSLKKWQGFRAEALEKHGLFLADGYLVEKVGADTEDEKALCYCGPNTCALCYYYRIAGHRCWHRDGCYRDGCPLQRIRDGAPCYTTGAHEVESPYSALVLHSNPVPMLELIRRAITAEADTKVEVPQA